MFGDDWSDEPNAIDAGYINPSRSYLLYSFTPERIEAAKTETFESIAEALSFLRKEPVAKSKYWAVGLGSALAIATALAICLAMWVNSLLQPTPPETAIVKLTATQPCELHIFPLDKYNEPIVEKGTIARAPAQLELAVGDYWISAIGDDGTWNEVIRRVSSREETNTNFYPTVAGQNRNGMVTLTPITIAHRDLLEKKRVTTFDEAATHFEMHGFRVARLEELDGKEATSFTSSGEFSIHPYGKAQLLLHSDGVTTADRFASQQTFYAVRSESPTKLK